MKEEGYLPQTIVNPIEVDPAKIGKGVWPVTNATIEEMLEEYPMPPANK